MSLSIDVDLLKEVDKQWLVSVVDEVDVVAWTMVAGGCSEIEGLFRLNGLIDLVQLLVDNHVVRSLDGHCVFTVHMIDYWYRSLVDFSMSEHMLGLLLAAVDSKLLQKISYNFFLGILSLVELIFEKEKLSPVVRHIVLDNLDDGIIVPEGHGQLILLEI